LFDLKNMKILESPSENEWKIVLKPGEKTFRHLEYVDGAAAWGYRYSYSYKCIETLTTEEELREMIKKKGKKS